MNKKWLDCLGVFPQRADSLDVEVIQEEELEGHYRKLIAYQTEPGERVKSYLLIPKSNKVSKNGKYPAVVANHQHAGNHYLGKSEAAGLNYRNDFQYGKELADRGYVVIVPDQLSFEDRRPPRWQELDNGSIDGVGYERYVYFQALMKGSTLQAKYLSDMECAIDVLVSQEMVDPERIGAIGHSMGGQETVWLMMHDERVKVGACSCGISTYRAVIEDRIIHSYSFYLPDLMSKGDLDEFMQIIAPRPFIMSHGSEDRIFPIRGVKEIEQSLSAQYSKLGAEQNFKSIIFDGGHQFTIPVRTEVYEWFDTHL